MGVNGGETKNVGDIAPTGLSGRQHQSLANRSVQNSPATLPRVEGSNPGFYPRDLEGRAMQAMHKFSRNMAGSTTPSWLPRRPQQGPPQEEFTPRELSSSKKKETTLAVLLLRNPFFDRFTRRPLEAAEKMLSPVPLVGMLAGQSFETVPKAWGKRLRLIKY